MVGYVASWKKRVAAVEEDLYKMIFQSSNLLLLYDFKRLIPALYGQPFLFWSKPQRFPYMGGVSFFRYLVQVLTLFRFSVICSEYYLQTTCRFIRGLYSTWVIFSDKLSGDVNPPEKLSQTVCHHNTGTWSTWVDLTYKLCHPFN